MSTSTDDRSRNPLIADAIAHFIREQVLFGQDTGLTSETALLELGILDSFALFKLVAHLTTSVPSTFGRIKSTGATSGASTRSPGSWRAVLNRKRGQPHPRRGS